MAPLRRNGLAEVAVAQTNIAYVDRHSGTLLYRGHDVRDLVRSVSYEAVTELLLEGSLPASPAAGVLPVGVPAAALDVLRALPPSASALDALRVGVTAWGAERELFWPPTVEQARELIALAPQLIAAYVHRRTGGRSHGGRADMPATNVGQLLAATLAQPPDADALRLLNAYLVAAAEHGLNPSTFALRIIISTQSDLASAVCGAIGALKGPLHGGAPAHVRAQLNQIGSMEAADGWIRAALARGERLMGFGSRAYDTIDPRADALREVTQEWAPDSPYLRLATQVEQVALRLLAERNPSRPMKTNIEYYTAAILDSIGLPPSLYTPVFAVARMAGWCAHALEQAADNALISPVTRYVGPPASGTTGEQRQRK